MYGEEDAEDYDVCTSFKSTGQCWKAGCTWRHPNAVWWEGAWWKDDGTGWGTETAAPAAAPSTASKPVLGWWRSLPASEECPVSLTRIRDLESEPFALTACAPGMVQSDDEPKHYFDAPALAMFLVSSSQFMNPVNRRPLELSECRKLDKHMGKTSLRVADAFLLAGGASSSSPAREVASVAHHLFHYPSARDAASLECTGGGASGPSAKPASIQDATREWRQPLVTREAKIVHSEGGLRVVDEGESGEEVVEDQAALFPDLGGNATPASKPRKAPRAPRPDPTQVREAAKCGSGGVTTQNGPGSKKSKAKERELDVEESVAPAAAASSTEPWIPPWASVELQLQQLREVEDHLLAGTISVDQPGLKAFRASVNNGAMMLEGDGLACEIRVVEADLVAHVTLPIWYPALQPIVSLQSDDATEAAEVLSSLERLLREEVLRPSEGSLCLEVLAEWLQGNAPESLRRLRQEHFEASAAAEEAAAAAARARPPPKADPTARVAEKYTVNWDLCSGFLKTGKCKNKNCKWRHELPAPKEAKKEEPAPDKSTEGKKKKR